MVIKKKKKQWGIQELFTKVPQLGKKIYKNPIADIILNDEKLDAFPVR